MLVGRTLSGEVETAGSNWCVVSEAVRADLITIARTRFMFANFCLNLHNLIGNDLTQVFELPLI